LWLARRPPLKAARAASMDKLRGMAAIPDPAFLKLLLLVQVGYNGLERRQSDRRNRNGGDSKRN
jgi:hypothetical protein